MREVLRRWRRRRAMARLLARLRENFAAVGFPVDHLTDEQLVEGVVAFTGVAAAGGLSTRQASEALARAAAGVGRRHA